MRDYHKQYKDHMIERLASINDDYWRHANFEPMTKRINKRENPLIIEVVNKIDGEIFTIDNVKSFHVIGDLLKGKYLISRNNDERLFLDMERFIILSVN